MTIFSLQIAQKPSTKLAISMRIEIKSSQAICQTMLLCVSKHWALSPKMTIGMINCFQIANLVDIMG